MSVRVSPEQAEVLEAYAEFLASAPLNLVARSARPVVRTHIEESIALRALLAIEPGTRWIDLGTGGGLPGVVLAVLTPATEWLLLDSVGKKVDAVAGFVRQAGIPNVEVRQGRAEVLAWEPALRGSAAGVISRAVAALDVVAEWSRGFLRPAGHCIAVKGPRVREELEAFEHVRGRLAYGAPRLVEVTDAVRPTWLAMLPATGPAPGGIPTGPHRKPRPIRQGRPANR